MRALAASILLILLTGSASAWGEFGHVLICEIAYRQISDQSREKLKELINQQSFTDEHGEKLYPSFNHACLREDEVRKRPKEHYINFPRNHGAVVDAQCPGSAKCLLSAIEQDKRILSDETASADDRFIALMALGHWIGDIHQPLHVSFADDRGGNDIKKRGECPARNLHAVWDSCILERKILTVEQPITVEEYAEFTPIYRAADWMIEEVTQDQISEWTSSEPWQWAAESYDIARRPEVGYCVQKVDTCWYSEAAQTYDGSGVPREIEITNDYLNDFRGLVVMRLEQAGFRLAAVLNEALTE
jgi:hypothetical protein